MSTERFRFPGSNPIPLACALLFAILGMGLSACSPPTSSSPTGDSPRQVTVQFNDGGATVPVGATSMTTNEGQALGQLPDPPARESVLFLGWYTDANGGERFDAQSPVQADMTVYARWRLPQDYGREVLPVAKFAASSDGTVVFAMLALEAFSGLVSQDHGATWSEVKPLEGAVAEQYNLGPVDVSDGGEYLVAGFEDLVTSSGRQVLQLSRDKGKSWTTLDPPGKAFGCVFAGSKLMVTGWKGEIWTTTDGGTTWTESNLPGTHPNFIVRSGDGSTLVTSFPTGYTGDTAYSTDQGAHWVTGSTTWRPVNMTVSQDGSTWVASDDFKSVLIFSYDRGKTWTAGTTVRSWEALRFGPSDLWGLIASSDIVRISGPDQWQSVTEKSRLSWYSILPTRDRLLAWNNTYGLVETKDGTEWTWAGRKTVIAP